MEHDTVNAFVEEQDIEEKEKEENGAEIKKINKKIRKVEGKGIQQTRKCHGDNTLDIFIRKKENEGKEDENSIVLIKKI